MFVRPLAAAGIAGALALGAAAPVFAQCIDLCEVNCVKPIAIPDRWDDVTGIPGYMGESTKRGNWRNNLRFDSEAFTDANANGLWDAGESYVDSNLNGEYDRELYDPATTGYNAGPSALSPAGDAGALFTLSPGSPGLPPEGQYVPIDFPPVNRGAPIAGDEEYRVHWYFESCSSGPVGVGDICQIEPNSMLGPTNQAMRDVIAQDPDAYWDPTTSSVKGSHFSQSPRIIFIPIHDPRVPVTSGNARLTVTKVAAFFMEQMTGDAIVQGHLVRAIGVGESCPGPGAGFVVECPTPAHPISWGRVKDLYR